LFSVVRTLLIGALGASLVLGGSASASTTEPTSTATATVEGEESAREDFVPVPVDPHGPAGLDGSVKEPQQDVNRLKAAQEAAPEPPRPALVTGYRKSGITMRTVTMAKRPYGLSEPLVPLAGNGLVDKHGVRMFRMKGDDRLWNHPVGQAQYALRNLESYRRTSNKKYLDRAIANAQRLVDRRVESRGGWFYPYDFDFAVHGDTSQTLLAPWYSGMAQGQALSVFTRLLVVTGDARWRTAADATFLSLQLAPVKGQPVASWVSSAGDLWLEEYPRWPVANSERVLNGHIFAAYGLYDYSLATKSKDAAAMFDGAITTVRRYLMSDFRRKQWASVYSLRHKLPSLSYHQVHVNQLLELRTLTGRSWFASAANTFRSDFPLRTSSGQVALTPRSTIAYQLNADRKIVRSRKVSFTRNTGAPADRRERAKGGPIMLRISAGPYTNWWFPEARGKAWLLGTPDAHVYDPALTVTFAGGTYSAYRLDSRGRVVGAKTVRLSRASNAPTGKSAIIEGRPAWYMSVGAFRGYWVPLNSKITVN